MTTRTGTLFWLGPILDRSDLDPTETLLLIALADHVDHEDRCYVSIATLAHRARVSYATARRRLVLLEQRGIISRDRRRRDDGNLSVYNFQLLRVTLAGEPSLNLSGDHRSPGRAVTIAHLDERAEVPHVEPPHNEHAALVVATEPPSSFEQFWIAYPRHVAKRAAQKAWLAAVVGTTSTPARATPDAVIVGARAYACDPDRTAQYTAHPATWLNADRWLDEATVPGPTVAGLPMSKRMRSLQDWARTTG